MALISTSDMLKGYIANRDVTGILNLMFERGKPFLSLGFNREDQLWDFKQDCPSVSRGSSEAEWAEISADVLAFHNQDGGIIFFGIRDSDYSFVGATQRLDTKLFNDKIRKYCGDKFWVSFGREYITPDQRYLGVAIIPPKSFAHQRLLKDAPPERGKYYFKAGDLCFRIGDETRILRGSEAIEYAATKGLGVSEATYAIEEPNFRVLRPDYKRFVLRKRYCDEVEKALKSHRTFVTSLTGIGGVGKTAISCWVSLKAYEAKWFDFIVSLSARDRALTNTGIVATKPTLSSLEDLIRQICETTGFTEYNNLPLEERIQRVRLNILGEFRGLLFVDNLETISDPALVRFLEDLPMPTKAIVTSRKVKIRVANFPVEIGPFEEREAISFLDETARSNRKQFLAEMAAAEKKIIVDGCDCIPLIIEWLVGRARDPQKAIRLAKSLTKDGGHGEELLEFSFRRVYAEMTGEQHAVLQVLALTSRPLPIEAIAIGSSLSPHEAAYVLEELSDYSLLEKIYDTSYRDVVYSLLPVTGSFIMRELSKQSRTELKIRKLLTDWYQAEDVADSSDRQLMQQVRRGERDPELALLEVARHLVEQNEFSKAENFFKQSIERNPRSWKCHWEFAEFYKRRGMIGESLKHFERAAEFSPKQGPDRASIFRGWGLLIKASGSRTALREAAPKLAEALKEIPTDHICRNALGECYVHIGSLEAAIHTLEPLRNVVRLQSDIRKSTLRLLEQCYKATNDIIKLAEVRNQQRETE